MLEIFKNTVYDREKYLKEQENFPVLKNISDIIKNMKTSQITVDFNQIEKEISNSEVIDFITNKLDKFLAIKELNCQNAIDNLEKYVDYQKKYNLKQEEIHTNIVNSIETKRKSIDFDLGTREFEEKYKWFLDQETNTEFRKINYDKTENIDKYWENGISILDKVEKDKYIENTSLSLYATENKDLKEYVFSLLDNKITDFEKSVEENQRSFYYEKDYDSAEKIYQENIEIPITDVNSKIEKINSDYSKLFHRNMNMIELLSNIEEIDINDLKNDIARDRTENIKNLEDISKSFTNSFITKEIEKNIDLTELGTSEIFNLDNKVNKKLEIYSKLERTVSLKNLDNENIIFNKDDIKPINKEMKDILKERENVNTLERPYIPYEKLEKITTTDYDEKKILCNYLNTLDISDVKITPSRLKIEDINNEYLSTITIPQYIASFETEKIGKDKVNNILFDLFENYETNYDIELAEKLFGNCESKYDLSIRDTIRKIGKDFYSEFIFNKNLGFDKTIELDKNIVIYLEKSDLEKTKDREKVLDLEFVNKSFDKEFEFEKDYDKTVDVEEEKINDVLEVNVYETREKIFNDLRRYPLIKESLEMLEENYDKDELYGNFDNYEDNLNNSISLTVDYLVREELRIDKSEKIEDDQALKILEKANIDDLMECQNLIKRLQFEKREERERGFSKETVLESETQDKNSQNSGITKDYDSNKLNKEKDEDEMEI